MGVEESDRLLSELSVELYIHELAYREGLGWTKANTNIVEAAIQVPYRVVGIRESASAESNESMMKGFEKTRKCII